jgi:AcrR family transcriptional regulator
MALIASGFTWPQLGVRQIAERAEISRTAFYDFFGSKNEVLEQLIRGMHEDMAHVLIEQLPGDDGTLAPALLDLRHLRGVLGTIAAYNHHHGPIYRAFLDATGEDPRLDDLWDDLIGIYADLVVQAIDQTRARHPNAPTVPDSRSLARVLLMMTERTMLLLLRQPAEADGQADLLEALAQVWERAVYGPALPAR